jgi:hypothetical protein
MRELEIGFHGICTHFRDVSHSGSPLNRVVLLECQDTMLDPHHALLSVPPSVTVEVTGDAGCKCLEPVGGIVDPGHPEDRHYLLRVVKLRMLEPVGLLEWDPKLWDCGLPKLTQLYPGLGRAAFGKVRQEPPDLVSAWFDVTAGTLTPFVSLKGAVAVRLVAAFDGPIRLEATCWRCKNTTWTFTFTDEPWARVSNDCGTPGDPKDFQIHYLIAEHPPEDGGPVIEKLPDCLPPPQKPPRPVDGPPGREGNASIGCSNSAYP